MERSWEKEKKMPEVDHRRGARPLDEKKRPSFINQKRRTGPSRQGGAREFVRRGGKRKTQKSDTLKPPWVSKNN